MSFTEAVDSFSLKAPQGSPWRTKEWNRVAPDVRSKTFFSAGVENMRFLQTMRDRIADHLEQTTEEVGGKTVFKTGGRKQFVDQLAKTRDELGISGKEFDSSRLELIFDTNTAQAYGFGRWKQQMSPELLDAFPAAEFVRNPGSLEERPRHTRSEGEIRLWTDFEYWADYQNSPDIGGFSLPFPPFGFNSNMDQKGVDRATAESLGMLDADGPVPGAEKIARITPLTSTKASLSGIDEDLRAPLLEYLKEKKDKSAKTRTTEYIARENAHLARMDALLDALDSARNSGDQTALQEIGELIHNERQRFDPQHKGDPFDFVATSTEVYPV